MFEFRWPLLRNLALVNSPNRVASDEGVSTDVRANHGLIPILKTGFAVSA
jgi:hypothetical protein